MTRDKFNPTFPLSVGPEWDVREDLGQPSDYGREYGFRFVPLTNVIVTGAVGYFEVSPADDFRSIHHATIYRADRVNSYSGQAQHLEQVQSSGTSTTGTVVNAGSAVSAISDPFDTSYCLLDSGSENVTAAIDLNLLSLSLGLHRILDVTFVIGMAPNVTGAASVNLAMSGGSTFARVNVTEDRIYRVSCGEYAPFATPRLWYERDDPMSLVISRSTGQIRVAYVAAEVTYCDENRVAASQTQTIVAGGTGTGNRTFTLRNYSTSVSGGPSAGITLQAGVEYIGTITRTSEITGDIVSDPTIIHQQRGPAPLLGGVLPADTRIVTPFEASRDNLGRLSSLVSLDRCASIAFTVSGGAFGPQAIQQPYAFTDTRVWNGYSQSVAAPANTVVCSHVRITARKIGAPGTVGVRVTPSTGPIVSAFLTEADYDAAVKDRNGFAQFTLPLNAPATITPATATIALLTTNGPDRWETPRLSSFGASGGQAPVNYGAFGGTTGGLTYNQNDSDEDGFYLVTAVPAVTGLVVTGGYMELAPVDDACDSPIFHTLDYAQVCWSKIPLISGSPATTGVGVTGFCAWEVERQDVDDPVWRPIASITDYDVNCFADMEARIGVPTSYRVRLKRLDGATGGYATATGYVRAGPSTSTGPPLATGGCQGLVFTSNEMSGATVAYPYAFESATAPREDFSFIEPENVVFQRLYMRDYQVMFRPLERGGVRFDRTLLVNALSTPPARLDEGFRSLRDLAWEALTYVCVLDTRGNRWFAAVLVPSGTVREANQVYLASVSIIEVTDLPTVVDATMA